MIKSHIYYLYTEKLGKQFPPATRRNLGIIFLKMGATLADLSASGKIPYWNERFIKNARGCFKSSAWFLIILTRMLHEPKRLLWLRFFVSFSISVSLIGLIKNEFKTPFLRGTYQKFFSLLVLHLQIKY